MAYDDGDWSTCKLFDVIYKKTYTVHTSTMKKYFEELKLQNPPQIHICASKSGWLLLCHSIPLISETAFFLYSPFTNRIIKLPNLKTSHNWVTATFSADPISADCVFFALYNSIHANTVASSTYRIGDTTWTTHVFPGRICAIDNVVYSEGLFWCATDRGRLATFSVAQGIWNRLHSPAPILLSYCVQDETYLVETNGNLLLILISHRYKRRHVFRLDRSQMSWVLVEDLGVCGKIHYCWDRECRFLSRNFKKSFSYPKSYGLLVNKECLDKLWIEPPC